MIRIGRFFFKYRNILFGFFYAFLFIPSPPIISIYPSGKANYLWPLTIGLCITITGQLIRGLTIGLAYIIRGGRQGKPFAETLVTDGLFSHCRNPLYVGNILMLLGMGILANSLYFTIMVFPVFVFIYHAMVLAEEDFLRKKFGAEYEAYCKRVNRWLPDLRKLNHTLSSMKFNRKRWIRREHTTQYIWLSGIVIVLFIKYPQLTNNNTQLKFLLAGFFIGLFTVAYLYIRHLKSIGVLTDE
ncbi:MAG: isoprenylcysteine carboxylmethyltransferase family protein [Chitinophagaceae bacterium]|nr:isoprenylcysteine carboxylmethyltransferase family protein [Chitinophagaceae bacterium]